MRHKETNQRKARPAAWPSALLAKHLIAAPSKTRSAQTICRLHPPSNTSLGYAATGFKTLKTKVTRIPDCSKMPGCKTRADMQNEAYSSVRRRSAPQQTEIFEEPSYCNSNLTGTFTHMATGFFPFLPGSKLHFLTASRAALSRTLKPLDSRSHRFATRPCVST